MIEDVTFEGSRAVLRKAAGSLAACQACRRGYRRIRDDTSFGHRIRPHEIGALAAYGISHGTGPCVRVGLLPPEVNWFHRESGLLPGQVVESNTVMASAWLVLSVQNAGVILLLPTNRTSFQRGYSTLLQRMISLSFPQDLRQEQGITRQRSFQGLARSLSTELQ